MLFPLLGFFLAWLVWDFWEELKSSFCWDDLQFCDWDEDELRSSFCWDNPRFCDCDEEESRSSFWSSTGKSRKTASSQPEGSWRGLIDSVSSGSGDSAFRFDPPTMKKQRFYLFEYSVIIKLGFTFKLGSK